MSDGAVTNPSIDVTEHDSNVSAKRVVPLTWDGTQAWKAITGLFQLPYDELAFTNADSNGNYQTLTSKLSGTTQNVFSITYDASSNLTDIKRTT